MRILHLAPLWFPISEDAPGGRETFLAGLIAALRRLDCHSTVLASGDSRVQGDVIPVLPRNLFDLMKGGHAGEYRYYEEHQLWLTLQHAAKFDLIHSHLSPGVYGLSAIPGIGPRVLHTLHTPVGQDMEWLVGQHPGLRLSTVSAFQAHKLWQHGATHCTVIYNATDVASFTFQAQGEGLVFLGRMEHAKGADLAIRVAHELGWPLTLAGPIVDSAFFDDAIGPRLSANVRYVGVLDHGQKNELLGQGACAILPFRGCEAFGMVTIEAMACGTPVVALANGALPEVVEQGITGYVTGDERDLPSLVLKAARLNRAMVRERVAARFDLPVAAAHYRALYRDVASHRP
jgi:glycosyltransferase involved in cell wall biosynthesis